jgi:hypothetical protein
MTISIVTDDKAVTLAAPYHPDLPAQARELGGEFDGNSKSWRFDPRDEQRVRELAKSIYGTDGTPTETVTVQINVDDYLDILNRQRGPEQLFLFGREVARRPDRDQRVRLGQGVVVISGGFPVHGGSVKNPALAAEDDTILEVRDVPASHPDITGSVTLIDAKVDTDALRAERERLLARIAEIDTLLGA